LILPINPHSGLFEAIFDTLAEPVLVIDISLCAIMANPALHALLRIQPGELEGKPVPELFGGETGQPRLREELEAALVHGTSLENVEIKCVIAPDTKKTLCLNARRITVSPSPPPLLLLELRDITHGKETERKVQHLNAALRQHGYELEGINRELESFTHSVSHDLRTPLRLTNKIAHLLLQDHAAQLPPEAADKIHMILDSTHEMGKLIEDLLRFSQVSREPMKLRPVDLRRLATEALQELQEELQGREVKVVIEELPACQGDRALMKQVFLNLLANAIKFTRPRVQAEIHLGFTQAREKTVYHIRDNGVGFDPSHAEAIFVPFHRLHKTQFEGSGVGLALVKRIVERHTGRIWAEGEVNQGATFYFTLREHV
jgi:signal transduction histidine kinase